MKLLVVVHIYYEHLWPELADCLDALPVPFDLRVTCVRHEKAVAAMVRERFPSARVEVVPNRGFDIGPFFHVLNSVDVGAFDVVAKLHTKRDIPEGYWMPVDVTGPKFRERSLSFARSPESWRHALKVLFRRGVGMVGEGSLLLNRASDPLQDYREVENVLHTAGLSFRGGSFVAGTMFLVRAGLLKPFQGRFVPEQFEVPDHSRGDCLPHFLERALGYAVQAQHFRVYAWETPCSPMEHVLGDIRLLLARVQTPFRRTGV